LVNLADSGHPSRLGSLVYMLPNYLTFQSFLLFEKRVIYTKMMSTYLLHYLGTVNV